MTSGFSSSAVAELALFQEMHSYSTSPDGHSTLLVPYAVVKGTGDKTCICPVFQFAALRTCFAGCLVARVVDDLRQCSTKG